MKEGGSGIAPLYEFEKTLPPEVLEKYNAILQQLLDGSLHVKLNLEPVTVE